MIEVYKMLNGRYDQDAEMQLPVNDNNTRTHQKKLYKEQSKTKTMQSRFRLRVADTRNSLPEYVVDWADQPICLDHESQIITTCRRAKLSRIPEDSDLDI